MIAALELLNETADRLGWPQFDTIDKPVSQLRPQQRKLLRLLNRILDMVGTHNDWPMLREDASLVLVAKVVSDTDPNDDGSDADGQFVVATNASTTITVPNITFDDTFINRGFRVNGVEEFYRITAVPSPTTLTLHKAWVGTSIVAADKATFTIGTDQYALPENFGRAVDDMRNFFSPIEIQPKQPNEFARRRRTDQTLPTGDPDIFTIYGLQNGRQVLHFHPFPDSARLLDFQYQKKHPPITSDQDQILYPNSYLPIFIDVLLQIANRDYEDSAKMQQVLADFLRQHNMHQANPGVTDSRPILEPANSTRRSVHAAYGTPAVEIDWGMAFDTGDIWGL